MELDLAKQLRLEMANALPRMLGFQGSQAGTASSLVGRSCIKPATQRGFTGSKVPWLLLARKAFASGPRSKLRPQLLLRQVHRWWDGGSSAHGDLAKQALHVYASHR
eukprot:1160163-Pelagomonas_calceolata.AAC.2